MNQLCRDVRAGATLPLFRFFALLVVLSFSVPETMRAEYLFLKDGAVVEGRILNENPAGIIFVNTDGKKTAYPRAKIIRISFSKLYLGKVYVRMTDGEMLEGFQVDEDPDNYTMRSELNKTAEFKIPRTQVMFIARSNPTDLSGEAARDSVKLRWNAPFVPSKSYKIYMKKINDKNYRVVGQTPQLEYTVDNLSINEKYSFYVTAIDTVQMETLPTNVIVLITGNTPPVIPGNLSGTMAVAGKGGAGKKVLKLSWHSAGDSDGAVQEYRVYTKGTLNKYKLQWSGNATSCELVLPEGFDPDIKYSVKVTAIDDRGGQSEGIFYPEAGSETGGTKRMFLSISPVAVYPFGDLSKLTSFGSGVKAGLYMKIEKRSNVMAGVEGGYIYWMKAGKTTNMYSLPIGGAMAYQYYLSESVKVKPKLTAGIEYFSASYHTIYRGKRSSSGYDPRVEGSLAFEYATENGLSVTVSALSAALYDTKKLIYYAGASVGLGYYF